MTTAIQEYYQVEKNCYSDLVQARKCFGNTATTEAEFEAMEKALGLMYLYCPTDLQQIVLATMDEAEFRKAYFSWYQVGT